MRKSIVLCLALVLSLFAVTGSIAYFTDTVEVQVEAKSGNLAIEQFELERTTKDNKVVLQEYTQNQAIYPAVGDINETNKDSYRLESSSYSYNVKIPKHASPTTEVEVSGTFTASLMDTTSLRGYVDKIVMVKNFGSLPVYVRTFVAVPTAFKDAIVLDWNASDNKDTTGWYLHPTTIPSDITHDNKTTSYTIYYATYNTSLNPNNDPNGLDIAPPSLLGFYLNPDFNYKGSETQLKILVATQAAQVIPTGIGDDGKHMDAVSALNETYDKDNNNENSTVTIKHPWASN